MLPQLKSIQRISFDASANFYEYVYAGVKILEGRGVFLLLPLYVKLD